MINLFLTIGLLLCSGLYSEVTAPRFERLPGEEAPARENFYSQASLKIHLLGKIDQPLEGFQVFLDGRLLGVNPLPPDSILIDKDSFDLAVSKENYWGASRKRLSIGREGIIDIAVLPQNPTSYYTRPTMLLGVLLMAGSLVAYAQPKGEGTGLAVLGSGLALASLGQIVSRFIHIPALERKLERHNQRHLKMAPR